jgi:hypothetical protein
MPCEQRLCWDVSEYRSRCVSMSDINIEYVPVFTASHRHHNLPDVLPANPTEFQLQVLKYLLRNMPGVLS